jgi:hypothetical protein
MLSRHPFKAEEEVYPLLAQCRILEQKVKDLNFSLKPFSQKEKSQDFRITGDIVSTPGSLELLYEVIGPVDTLVLPPASENPKRTDRLWEETCLELFLNPDGADTYWELNLSPSGDWNVYRFDAYRVGMQMEERFTSLPFRIKSKPDILSLVLELETGRIIPMDSAVNLGISAILKSESGMLTYWSLAHNGAKPDFHRKDGFAIKI